MVYKSLVGANGASAAYDVCVCVCAMRTQSVCVSLNVKTINSFEALDLIICCMQMHMHYSA